MAGNRRDREQSALQVPTQMRTFNLVKDHFDNGHWMRPPSLLMADFAAISWIPAHAEPATALGDAVTCENCPTFVPVPAPPASMRRISHVANVELTWNQYLAAHDNGACPIPRSDNALHGEPKRELDDHIELFRIDWPATKLGPAEIDCYADWLSERLGREVAIPTADEWLWFARSGREGIRFPWGDDPNGGAAAIGGMDAIRAGRRDHEVRVPYADWPRARHVSRHLNAVKVGQYPPNDWGLYDVFGNAWELTADISDWTPPPDGPRPNPFAGSRQVRIVGESHGLADWEAASLEGGPNYVMIINGRYSASVAVRFVLLE